MSTFIGSPNYTSGRQGQKVNGVIIHWMAGNLASTDSVFQNRTTNTSAHYGVEDGNVHQYVKEEDTAYQAGNWVVNTQTIGIEHSAQPGRDATDATYESSAKLIAAAAKKWGFNVVTNSTARPHSFIVATQCPGTVDVTRLVNRANEILGSPVAPPAAVPTPPASATGTVNIIVDVLNARAEPNSTSAIKGQFVRGTASYTAITQGQNVNGVSTWLKSLNGNWFWAGGTDFSTPAVQVSQGGRAMAKRVANVRSAPNTSAPLSGSMTLSPGQYFDYTAKVTGETVSQNGVRTNVWYHSTRGNYVWGGNLEDV